MASSRRERCVPFVGTVVIDTREQQSFTFLDFFADARDGGGPLVVPMQRGTLRSGDYSLAGYEDLVAVERKSITDLFGTLAGGRKRFEAELDRLNSLVWSMVVCEADWLAILESPPRHSKLPPKIVFRSIVAWMQKYPNVHWQLMPSRRLAEVMTLRALERFARQRLKQDKE